MLYKSRALKGKIITKKYCSVQNAQKLLSFLFFSSCLSWMIGVASEHGCGVVSVFVRSFRLSWTNCFAKNFSFALPCLFFISHSICHWYHHITSHSFIFHQSFILSFVFLLMDYFDSFFFNSLIFFSSCARCSCMPIAFVRRSAVFFCIIFFFLFAVLFFLLVVPLCCSSFWLVTFLRF